MTTVGITGGVATQQADEAGGGTPTVRATDTGTVDGTTLAVNVPTGTVLLSTTTVSCYMYHPINPGPL